MNQERLLKIILAPHMSEKAAIGSEKRRDYVFEVASDATKPEVKAAVELLFNTGTSSTYRECKKQAKAFRPNSRS
jgi:large subunit ribosomal protein L23